jgi:prefoldin subunit 5
MNDKPSAPERVQVAFRGLSAVSSELNAASDALGQVIAELDSALQKLNLGVSAWVEISKGADDYGSYWSRDVGYTKIGSTWGIALREVDGHESTPDDTIESWLFNSAPRWLRIEAVGKIPDLLEKLIKQAEDTTKRLKKKTDEAKALTAAMKEAAATSKAVTGK